jgi:putative ABC transport system ATP-binding protein
MLHLRGVKKIYTRHSTKVVAFQCDDLLIEKDEFVGILGPSGSGKTTLLSILGGMMSPTEGEVWLDEEPLYSLTVEERAQKRQETIGFVFQAFNLIPYLTAQENVQIPLCIGGFCVEDQRERAEEMLSRFGLKERLNHKPSELSVGQQQRVALARTLVTNPKLILADEPTGNLDPESRELVLSALKQCQMEGRTVVMVTHDPVAASRATRTLQLRGGELLTVKNAEPAAA